MIDQIWYSVPLENVWWMHYNLTTAAERINHVYSIQLLSWIFSFSLNGLSRIYTLINSDQYTNIFTELRDVMCAFGCFINLFIITISCHLTSRQVSVHSTKKKWEINIFCVLKTGYIFF